MRFSEAVKEMELRVAPVIKSSMMKEEITEEELDQRHAEPLQPITAINWSGWPEKPKQTKPTKDLPLSTKRMIEWARKKYLRERLPIVFPATISGLQRPDLLTVASMFKAYRKEDFLMASRAELIQFILGHRCDPEQYYPLKPMPHGTLPDLD